MVTTLSTADMLSSSFLTEVSTSVSVSIMVTAFLPVLSRELTTVTMLIWLIARIEVMWLMMPSRHGVAEIRELLLDLKAAGKTILLASHNDEDIRILCDHVYEMDGGVLRERTA